MATRAESLWASVVHDAAPRARAETLFATVVHTAAPRARALNLFATVVHTVSGTVNSLQGSRVEGTVVQGFGVSNLGPGEVGR